MKVLVADTSALIDLDCGWLITRAFRLPLEFTVPDLLYERELKAHGRADLVRLGLRVEELDGNSVAVALAKTNAWTLLSGDRELRDLAEEEAIACHGVLWRLDRIFEHRVVDPGVLRAGLDAIAAHPRCRLPRSEIRKRLRSFSTA